MTEKLYKAIESIKAGNKQQGQQLLAQVLQSEPNNEQAWLWMSAVVDDDKRKYCIGRVLAINPNNTSARKAFAELNKISNPQQTVDLKPVSKPLPKSQNPEHSNLQLKELVKEEKNSEANSRIVVKDSLSIGIICGILGIPTLILFGLISLILLPTILTQLFTLFFIIFPGIATGVRLLRKGVISLFGLTSGGAISGFISGAIWSLSIGFLFTTAYYPILNTSLYLLWCGFLIPLVFGVINAFSVWLPRIFIDPTKPDEPFSIIKFTRYFSREESPNVIEIKDVPFSTSGEKYWINNETDKNNVFLLLDKELIIGSTKEFAGEFADHMMKGNIDLNFLKVSSAINYDEINSITFQGGTISIQSLADNKANNINFDCKNSSNSKELFTALQSKLGAKFKRTVIPANIKKEIQTPGILFLGVISFSLFFYFSLTRLTINQVASFIGKEYLDQIIDIFHFLLHDSGIILISGSISVTLLGIMIYRIINLPDTEKLVIKETTFEVIQRAVTHIKAGEIQKGQRLLNQVIKDEPNNEAAWFWMSYVVSANKKAFYLEKVLEINPNNQEALEAIQKIKQEEKQAELIEKEKWLKNRATAEISQQQSKINIHESAIRKFWIFPARKETLLLIILDDNLIAAKSQKSSAYKIQTELSLGNIPHALLTEKTIIDFKNIKIIEESLNTIRIEFLDKSGKENATKIEVKNDAMAAEILEFLEKSTKVIFNRQVAPMSISRILLSNSIVLSIVTGVSIFFYYAALDIEKNNTAPTGSARTRGIINLLTLLGPGGVACIGGGVFLLLVVSLVTSILRPPIVTTLTPQAHKEIKN